MAKTNVQKTTQPSATEDKPSAWEAINEHRQALGLSLSMLSCAVDVIDLDRLADGSEDVQRALVVLKECRSRLDGLHDALDRFQMHHLLAPALQAVES